jgi:hypothetical protein
MLFNTLEDLKQRLAGVQKKWANETALTNAADMAANKHLIPVLGRPLYLQLEAAAHAAAPVTPTPTSTLLNLVQQAAAFYTLYEMLPLMNVSVGDFGIHDTTTDKSAPTSQWRYYNLLQNAANNADAALDAALLYIDSEPSSTWPSWITSPHYILSQKTLIRSTDILDNLLPILGSRRAYLQLRPFIAEAEQTHLVPVLGATLIAQLKATLTLGTLTDLEKSLLEIVQKALAKLALHAALPFIPVVLDGGGIKVRTYQDYYKTDQKATEALLNSLKTNSEVSGTKFLNMALDFLAKNANEAVFASWLADFPAETTKEPYHRGVFYI